MSDHIRVLMTHPHDGHAPNETCLDCQAAGRVRSKAQQAAEEPLRIWWNKNLHGKITPGKLAAHAAHAALAAYGIKYSHPIVVLSASKGRIASMPVVIRDEGRTELEPGTLTTGVERMYAALPEVPDPAVIEAMAATVHDRFRFSGWDAASEDDREDAIEMARAAYAALRGAMQ